jgi:hypothetical protein
MSGKLSFFFCVVCCNHYEGTFFINLTLFLLYEVNVILDNMWPSLHLRIVLGALCCIKLKEKKICGRYIMNTRDEVIFLLGCYFHCQKSVCVCVCTQQAFYLTSKISEVYYV